MKQPRNAVQVVRAGNVAIPIYQTSKGYMAHWTIGCERKRSDRVELSDPMDWAPAQTSQEFTVENTDNLRVY